MPHPSWALQFCSPNSCLHRETRKPGENSDMDGIVQTLPTLGLCGFIFQPESPLKAVIMMLRPTHKKNKTVKFILLWCPIAFWTPENSVSFHNMFLSAVLGFQRLLPCILDALAEISWKVDYVFFHRIKI